MYQSQVCLYMTPPKSRVQNRIVQLKQKLFRPHLETSRCRRINNQFGPFCQEVSKEGDLKYTVVAQDKAFLRSKEGKKVYFRK